MNKLELPNYLDKSPQVQATLDAMKAREPVLEVKNLCKYFETKNGTITALNNVSFKTHRREFVTVIGQSGCGKSTLIRTLAGLETKSTGDVLLDGQQVTGPGPDRGMVFQGYTLFPWLTVKKNVMYGLRNQGKTMATSESEALQWLELIGLEKFKDSYPDELSGGMKQRVAIARALAKQPEIILLDEPFSHIDNFKKQSLRRSVFKYLKDKNIACIVATHHSEDVLGYDTSTTV